MPQLWILLFVSLLTIFVAAALVWWRLVTNSHRQKLEQLVREVDPARATVTTTVLHAAPSKNGSQPDQFLQAGSGTPVGTGPAGEHPRRLQAIALALGLAGLLVGSRLQDTFGVTALPTAAIAFGAIPYALVARRKRRRMAAIEDQFPEVLDFLARSVRAGNALFISLEMLAGEAAEPLRSEFLKVTRELALGASLENALSNLAVRVPLIETRFFVAAVLLQREAGGNLAEVLGRLATSLRDRLRLRGHVKSVSGQGRLTARILTALPIVVMVMLKIISPQFLEGLTGEPLGRTLLGAAVVAQILGYLCMRKITNIEV
ncbi:MAG: type II secretion system F family protein [Acidobacteriia bacterium]|nr:type II secretion system F family protein [Terriglobia bacterium]